VGTATLVDDDDADDLTPHSYSLVNPRRETSLVTVLGFFEGTGRIMVVVVVNVHQKLATRAGF
jgi:hypothetical protein